MKNINEQCTCRSAEKIALCCYHWRSLYFWFHTPLREPLFGILCYFLCFMNSFMISTYLNNVFYFACLNFSVVSLCNSMYCPTKLLCSWNSSGKNTGMGTSLVVQWIRLCSQCTGPGSVPGQGTRPHMAKLSSGAAK